MVIRFRLTDKANERYVANEIEKTWKVKLVPTGFLSPVDYLVYSIRNDLLGAIEIKSRRHTFREFPSIYVSERKYKALQEFPNGWFFVKYKNDVIKYLNIKNIDPSRVIMAGRRDRVNAPNDIERIIDVPISKLEDLSPLTIGGDHNR